MKAVVTAGIYKTVLLNGKRIALLGNIEPGIFAGLSMGPFVKESFRKSGGRR